MSPALHEPKRYGDIFRYENEAHGKYLSREKGQVAPLQKFKMGEVVAKLDGIWVKLDPSAVDGEGNPLENSIAAGISRLACETDDTGGEHVFYVRDIIYIKDSLEWPDGMTEDDQKEKAIAELYAKEMFGYEKA